MRKNNSSEQNSPAEGDYLARVGARVRSARARRGMTRKILSGDSGVSERYLADLENGRGNISILLLRQIAVAMNMQIEDLVREAEDPDADLALIIEQLRRLEPAALSELQQQLTARLGDRVPRHRRFALIGLRGAGKSTLGAGLAERLDIPFVQLNQEIETETGMSINEIFDMRGQAAYRRLERQCLDQVLDRLDAAVIETGGGLVAEPATYQRLLSACYTIWLQAPPEEHMNRVIAQGDSRPMEGNAAAMEDLRRILEGRRDLYRKADSTLDTSQQSVQACLDRLEALCRKVMEQQTVAA
jgi:XRE family aerobic/anaerobic benzoate catabolism transcriptional regulator